MVLTPGTRLGPYEILSALGAGGMGEVYRATDTNLKRQVAIKVLPVSVAGDMERLARFQREAEVLAALNHPNIAHIHGLEKSDGTTIALVMELVEGPTLADRIAQGAIPLDEALPIARQIAEALEAAHEQGIIHRDLKPANIKVRPDGTVKVLDFGLAKAMEPVVPGNANMTHSPTITTPAMMTGVGVILGTAAYMAPEQARGKIVDKRADIWAFGCVLFEMLASRRAFPGEDITDTIVSVVSKEPDWRALPASAPLGLRRVLTRCLKKDAKARLQAIGDARVQIEELLSGAEEIGGSPAAPSLRPQFVAVASALVAVVAVCALWVVWRRPLAPGPLTHLQMSVLPADQLVGSISSVRPSRTAVALSPDGRLVAFSAMRGTVTQLYARGLDHGEAMPVPGTEGAIGPFFSPDGRWIGFWVDDKIKKVPIAGGPPATISDAARGPFVRGLFGASWGEDGIIYFGGIAGISQVSSDGGTPIATTTPDSSKGERHLLPHALPGGKALLFTAQISNVWETANVVLQSLETGERHVLIEGGADARYVATGHLLYMKTGTLMAVPFDLRSLRVTGAPVALTAGVMQAVNAPNGSDDTGAGQFAVSNSGTLLYVVGGASPSQEGSLVWVDRRGTAQPLVAAPGPAYLAPRLSPDGQTVAVNVRGPQSTGDVWVYDVRRGSPTRLTFSGQNRSAIWSPDGKRLAYSSNAAGVLNLYAANADSSGTPERLTTSEYAQDPSSWSLTGKVIAFLERHPVLNQIWILPLDGDRKPRLFLESRFNLFHPAFSPDGHWLAYTSEESGDRQVYVQPYPGPGEKRLISANGGQEPIWTANGRELLYRTVSIDGQRFFSAAILSLTPFRADTPRLMFEATALAYSTTQPVRGWDVSADGQRFLLTRFVQTDKPVTEMHVVMNWTEELKRFVPTK